SKQLLVGALGANGQHVVNVCMHCWQLLKITGHPEVRKNLKQLQDSEYKTMSRDPLLRHEERKKTHNSTRKFTVVNCKDHQKCSLNTTESCGKELSNIPPIKLGRRLEPMA
ncbi:hypothetical protein PoB_001232400, partial [Plakobranchus ocellatus]